MDHSEAPVLDAVAVELARATRAAIEDIDGLHVLGAEFLGPDLAADLDPLQVIIDLTGLGISGYRAADWVRDHHPGERLTPAVLDYLRTGVRAGMVVPDAVDRQLSSIRVLTED